MKESTLPSELMDVNRSAQLTHDKESGKIESEFNGFFSSFQVHCKADQVSIDSDFNINTFPSILDDLELHQL